jgi:hypothetical protein
MRSAIVGSGFDKRNGIGAKPRVIASSLPESMSGCASQADWFYQVLAESCVALIRADGMNWPVSRLSLALESVASDGMDQEKRGLFRALADRMNVDDSSNVRETQSWK